MADRLFELEVMTLNLTKLVTMLERFIKGRKCRDRVAANKAPVVGGSAKRILIYGINYAPEPIGVGRYTGEFGAYLSQQSMLVDVVTAVPHYPGWRPRDGYRNIYRIEILSGAHIVRCPLILMPDMRGLWRLIAPLSFAISSAPVAIWKILVKRPDVILCVEPTLLSAPIALLCAKIIGARTVLHVQDLEIDAAFAVGHIKKEILRRLSYWFESLILRAFSSVITISNGMRNMLSAKGVREDRLNIVRNWVDTDTIKPMPNNPIIRRELGLTQSDFVVLYSGNIGPKQALSLLLDVAGMLRCRSDLVFIVAGDGPEKESLVSRYGHLPNVHFLPVQPKERFHELLSMANCHILPQHSDTTDMLLPSKLGGMLASGKPCIVMANVGTELYDFLSDAAILVPSGQSSCLADAIADLRDGRTVVNTNRQLGLARELDSRIGLKALFHIVLYGKSD